MVGQTAPKLLSVYSTVYSTVGQGNFSLAFTTRCLPGFLMLHFPHEEALWGQQKGLRLIENPPGEGVRFCSLQPPGFALQQIALNQEECLSGQSDHDHLTVLKSNGWEGRCSRLHKKRFSSNSHHAFLGNTEAVQVGRQTPLVNHAFGLGIAQHRPSPPSIALNPLVVYLRYCILSETSGLNPESQKPWVLSHPGSRV